MQTLWAATTWNEINALQDKRLSDALERLKEQRQHIMNESMERRKSYHSLLSEVKALRSKVHVMESLRDNRSIELEELQNRVLAKSKEWNYIQGVLFPEFLTSFETSLSVAERPGFRNSIKHYRQADEVLADMTVNNSGATRNHSPVTLMIALIHDIKQRCESLFGGQMFAGDAIDSAGLIHKGRFVQCGPLLYFKADDGTLAGVALEQKNSLTPRIYSVSSSLISETLMKGQGMLPVDVSLGSAVELSETHDTLSRHLARGGVFVYPIVLLAMIAVVIAGIKSWQIFRLELSSSFVLHSILVELRKGHGEVALTMASKEKEPCRKMLMDAVINSQETPELVEEIMYETLLDVQPRLERYLNIIAVTAAAAPLLGLLGTVTGIIKTFNLMMVFGSGNPKPLISGISEALITTELGLILAIPALIMHAVLSRRVTSIMAQMEKIAVTFINGLSRMFKHGAQEPHA